MKYRVPLIVFVMVWVAPYSILSQSTSTASRSINSVFISDEFLDVAARFNTGEFERRLKGLLQLGGLATPDDTASADATLLVETSVIATLHGSIDEKDVMMYVCTPVTKEGKEIWKLKQTFVKKEVPFENNVFAAQRVAEKLISAWKRGKLRI